MAFFNFLTSRRRQPHLNSSLIRQNFDKRESEEIKELYYTTNSKSSKRRTTTKAEDEKPNTKSIGKSETKKYHQKFKINSTTTNEDHHSKQYSSQSVIFCRSRARTEPRNINDLLQNNRRKFVKAQQRAIDSPTVINSTNNSQGGGGGGGGGGQASTKNAHPHHHQQQQHHNHPPHPHHRLHHNDNEVTGGGAKRTSSVGANLNHVGGATGPTDPDILLNNNKKLKQQQQQLRRISSSDHQRLEIDNDSTAAGNDVDDSTSGAICTATDELYHQLQHELNEMANERTTLAQQLGEQSDRMQSLRNEIDRLKTLQAQANCQVEQLSDENTMLRNRLRDVAHSPLSDAEKQQLLLYDDHHQRQHSSSAPASITTSNLGDGDNYVEAIETMGAVPNRLGGGGGDVITTTAPIPTSNWDKQYSSSNVSEVSVACLQDKINQMQETHYSTSEELQATLQELTDLQKQLVDIQQENERLQDEKNLMFESLCRQTERLNDSRKEVECLKELIYTNTPPDDEINPAIPAVAPDAANDDPRIQDESSSVSCKDRELKLLNLLKMARDERDSFLHKQQELLQAVDESRHENLTRIEQMEQLHERLEQYKSTLDLEYAEHKLLDQEVSVMKDQSSGQQIEINHLRDLLDNAHGKIYEMEQDRSRLDDTSEMSQILDVVRKEKNNLEAEVTHLREQLALSRNEAEKLRDQQSILHEECKVIRNNAKSTQSDLEYKCEKLLIEKTTLNEQLQQLETLIGDMQLQAQCQLDDKRQLSTVLAESQRNLNEAENRCEQLIGDVDELKRLRNVENEEWEKFQNDLLTSVRVANDFKTEAQQDLQKMILENKAHRDRVKHLEIQLEKMKVNVSGETLAPSGVHVTRPSTFPGVEDWQIRRPMSKVSLCRQNSQQSVRSLIESIEKVASTNAPLLKTLSGNGGGANNNNNTNSNSNTSLNSTSPPTPVVLSPLRTPQIHYPIKTPLREHQPTNQVQKEWRNALITDATTLTSAVKCTAADDNGSVVSLRNSFGDVVNDRKDPLNTLVKNGGSKRNALLKWCQTKTVGYRNIDITNFSSSWNDGLALCALLDTYLPDRIHYDNLTATDKRRNFTLAFAAAESVGIPTILNINDMVQLERPDWQQVMTYVTMIYKTFET